MKYEELLISIDLKGYDNVLPIVGMTCLDVSHWFVVCDDGDCHLFDRYGKEDDISKVKEIYEDMIPRDIKKIVIPNSVTSIEDWTFWCYSTLKNVMILNSVTSIGKYAFYDCNGLTSVTIGNSITKIGDKAFKYCNNLKSLIFKNKTFKQVKSMDNYPFGIEDESIIRCN